MPMSAEMSNLFKFIGPDRPETPWHEVTYTREIHTPIVQFIEEIAEEREGLEKVRFLADFIDNPNDDRFKDTSLQLFYDKYEEFSDKLPGWTTFRLNDDALAAQAERAYCHIIHLNVIEKTQALLMEILDTNANHAEKIALAQRLDLSKSNLFDKVHKEERTRKYLEAKYWLVGNYPDNLYKWARYSVPYFLGLYAQQIKNIALNFPFFKEENPNPVVNPEENVAPKTEAYLSKFWDGLVTICAIPMAMLFTLYMQLILFAFHLPLKLMGMMNDQIRKFFDHIIPACDWVLAKVGFSQNAIETFNRRIRMAFGHQFILDLGLLYLDYSYLKFVFGLISLSPVYSAIMTPAAIGIAAYFGSASIGGLIARLGTGLVKRFGFNLGQSNEEPEMGLTGVQVGCIFISSVYPPVTYADSHDFVEKCHAFFNEAKVFFEHPDTINLTKELRAKFKQTAGIYEHPVAERREALDQFVQKIVLPFHGILVKHGGSMVEDLIPTFLENAMPQIEQRLGLAAEPVPDANAPAVAGNVGVPAANPLNRHVLMANLMRLREDLGRTAINEGQDVADAVRHINAVTYVQGIRQLSDLPAALRRFTEPQVPVQPPAANDNANANGDGNGNGNVSAQRYN